MNEKNIKKIMPQLEEFSGYELELKKAYKNGIEVNSIQVNVPGNIKPCLNIEDFTDDDPVMIAKRIVEVASNIPDLDTGMLTDEQYILDHVYIAAENIQNEEALQYMNAEYEVHPTGLLLVYYCRISPEATFKIPAGRFNINDLRRHALCNMAQRYSVKSMFETLLDMKGIEPPEDLSPEEENKLMVITNDTKIYGAGMIFCKDALDEARFKMHEDEIYILPSSIHEILAVPADDVSKYETMVSKVNDTQVEPKDLLSYHVFKWDGQDLKLA